MRLPDSSASTSTSSAARSESSGSCVELKGGQLLEGPPKTAAGRRTIALPPHVVPELAVHLAYVRRSRVRRATSSRHPTERPLRRSNFNRRVWQPACADVGSRGFDFHDLRHTGNTFAASTGASTKELMARMGHSSPRAALIYQHATLETAIVPSPTRSPSWPEAPEAKPPRCASFDERPRRALPFRYHEPIQGDALEGHPAEGESPDHTGWRRWDSNPRPPACKAGALAN